MVDGAQIATKLKF